MPSIVADTARRATSTTLLTGLALAGLLIESGQYWPAVVVYGLYVLRRVVSDYADLTAVEVVTRRRAADEGDED